MIGVGSMRAVVSDVGSTVLVGVMLNSVLQNLVEKKPRLADVAAAVAVGVLLVRVQSSRAVVTGVPYGVAVGILLQRVGELRTIVVDIGNSIIIAIRKVVELARALVEPRLSEARPIGRRALIDG